VAVVVEVAAAVAGLLEVARLLPRCFLSSIVAVGLGFPALQ
jgi:hypothetical protein